MEETVKKKKSKKGILLFFVLIILVGGIAGVFLMKNQKEKPNNPSNSNEEPSNSNKNEIKSDKISVVVEDVNLIRQYGNYFEVEKEGEYSLVDSKGTTILENPLYLSHALSDGKVVYKGKPLVVFGTFEKYKVYYSSDAPELGYVVIFNDVLDYQSNKVQDFYIGNDIVITFYWNQKTDENLIVKYNLKTGAVLSENFVDGSLDLFFWNDKNYLSVGHENIIDLNTLEKVFQKEYTLGEMAFADSTKIISYHNKYLTAKLNGKYGIIDASEKVIIPFNYLGLEQTKNNVVIARTKDGLGLIDYQNQKVLDFAYDKIEVYNDYIVTIDHNGILKVLNSRYEPLFTGTHKLLLTRENGSNTSQNIREKWNVLAYYNMLSTNESTSYFAILDIASGKSKELLDYSSYEKVNRSPSGYGYVVFMSDDNFSVYDGIVEVSKVNVSEYGFTSVNSFYYVGSDYIVFNTKKKDDTEIKQYFINMKKNIIELPEEVTVKPDEILTYDELFDNGYFLKYENGRINIYDANNNLLCSIIGKVIEPMNITDNTYYLIQNEDKVTIIRINEK